MRASWVLISGCGMMYRCLEFSPGVRGWTEHETGPGTRVDGFPRCAGVDRCRPSSSRSVGWFPLCAGVDLTVWTSPRRLHRFPPVCGGGPVLEEGYQD